MFSFFKKKDPDTSRAEQIAMSALMKLMAENDLLEIELLLEEKVLKIGVSSNYDHRRKPEYFDKRYYIDETEYPSPAAFAQAFSKISARTTQTVLRIDGVAPMHYNFNR